MLYSMDEMHIYNSDTYTIFECKGWAMDEMGKCVDVSFVFDCEAKEIESERVQRGDVYDHFQISNNDKIGFRKRYLLYSPSKHIQLTIDNVPVKKFRTDKIPHRHLIQYGIDHIVYADQVNEFAIFGWAFGIKKENVDFEVFEGDKKVDIRIAREKRFDVSKQFECEENCGFHIWFHGKKDAKYTLKLIDETTTQTIPIHISRQNRLKSSIRNYYHATRTFMRVYNGMQHIKTKGLKTSLDRISSIYDEAKFYHTWFMCNRVSEKTLCRERTQTFPYMPKISIITPTYNTPSDYLTQMIESVIQQSYANWELCIADGSDANHPVKQLLKKYTNQDSRIKVTYLQNNLGISENTNVAIDMAKGDYIAFFDHDDFLELDALYEVVKRINETDCDLIYTDEDKYLSESKRYFMPAFKPDYSPDLLLSDNYICHWTIVKSHIAKDLKLRKAFDGSQDYDFLLRVTERTDKIEHIGKVLYHWRMSENSTAANPESKMYCFENGKKALEEHLQNLHQKAVVTMLKPPYYGYYHVTYIPQNNPKVSIIIPNHNQKETLERCINSLQNINTYKNIEIIIVENNSTQQELFDYYKQCEANGIKVIRHDQPSFNYSDLNNVGVKYSMGEILLFLNNDTEVIEKDSIKEMVGIVQRESTGCVGAKLLYDNYTIQHCGVLYTPKITAGHAYARTPMNDASMKYLLRTQVTSNYSALTGACLMVRKDVFDKVNGFDESFPVAYNDVDFCLKVRALGLWNVVCTFSVLMHYESLTRGDDLLDPQKKERLKQDSLRLQTKWKEVFAKCDPFYHPLYDEERLFQLKL